MTTTQKMMTRTGVLFAATLLALVVFSGVALALTITCTTSLCEGTSSADTLYERVGDLSSGDETIYGRGGHDDIIATNYEGDNDVLYGGGGVDVLNAQDHSVGDTLNGGKGFDICYIDRDTALGAQDATTGCENVRVLSANYD